MASEIEVSIKRAAEHVATYVKDVARLKVTTNYTEIGTDGSIGQPRLAAETEINLDGDSQTTVPMRRSADSQELEVDTVLFDIHEENVEAAIEYRTRMIDALLSILKTSIRDRV
jgi:hypothetical protein